MTKRIIGSLIAMFVLVVTSTLASASSPARYAPHIDPADFTTTIDNQYLPLPVGARWVYEGTASDGHERNIVEVLPQTKVVMGVTTVVVHDQVLVKGEVTEDTFDWYAQDHEGNVWYFGEDSRELKHGRTLTSEGSWQAGVRGGQPGIVMPAHPKLGQRYRQEYLRGTAEDEAEILALDESAKVPFGAFDAVIKTKDYSALEPKVVEHKLYAKGVGVILEVAVKGPRERSALVEYTP